MQDVPRAVVVPFGVPEEARGLGLGLAALIHAHAQIRGGSVALARLEARKVEDPDPDVPPAPPEPVEAFFTPAAWRDVQGAAEPPATVEVIVTGTLEPPGGTRGLLAMMVFDAKDGTVRASIEVGLEDDRAGDVLAGALGDVLARADGDAGALADLAGLGWEALESVLLGERSALFDPARGGPHDRLASMLHLGRAVADAPDVAYPARRLAALAMDAALAADAGGKLAEAARRALERALADAPGQADLAEALCCVCVRLGDAQAAETRAEALTAAAPERIRAWSVLAEARRARRDHDGALAAIVAGLAHAPTDAGLCVERGVVLAERGEFDDAVVCWREVLLRTPLHPGAFANLAQLAMVRGDTRLAHELVDAALGAAGAEAHPEVYRRALDLAIAAESGGLPRASRAATLARAVLSRVPDDAHATTALAQAMAQMGDSEGAATVLRDAARAAPGTTLAAEAQRGLFALREPQVAAEIDAVMRAAMTAEERELEGIAARARLLALGHAQWLAHFALGVAEKRRRRWIAARDAFAAALELAPGCGPVITELAEVEPQARAARASDPPGALWTSSGPIARLRQSFARLRK